MMLDLEDIMASRPDPLTLEQEPLSTEFTIRKLTVLPVQIS